MNPSSALSYVQCNVNGQLLDARTLAISPLDRGFLYGDAIYEVWRSYGGVLFAWREHWERLEATACGLGLDIPFSREEAFEQIKRTAAAWRQLAGSVSDLYVRLQITRGGGPIGLDVALADAPSYAIYVKAMPSLSEEELDRGVTLHVASKWRRNAVDALPPSLKTGNYLNNILGLKEAKEAGADDVLFLNAAGSLTEASTRNLWLVFGDRIATPRMEDGVLGGVTRRLLLEDVGSFEGLPLVEETLGLSALEAARECFLSSTTQDVQPVRSVGGRSFPLSPDTVARRLKRRFQSLVSERSRENAKLSL